MTYLLGYLGFCENKKIFVWSANRINSAVDYMLELSFIYIYTYIYICIYMYVY